MIERIIQVVAILLWENQVNKSSVPCWRATLNEKVDATLVCGAIVQTCLDNRIEADDR